MKKAVKKTVEEQLIETNILTAKIDKRAHRIWQRRKNTLQTKDDFMKVLDIENSDGFTNLDRKSNGLFLNSEFLRPTPILT